MENIVLVAVIVFLIILQIVKEVLHFLERDKLTNKIMASDFLEYSNYDLAKQDMKTKEVKENKYVI